MRFVSSTSRMTEAAARCIQQYHYQVATAWLGAAVPRLRLHRRRTPTFDKVRTRPVRSDLEVHDDSGNGEHHGEGQLDGVGLGRTGHVDLD